MYVFTRAMWKLLLNLTRRQEKLFATDAVEFTVEFAV